MLRGRKNPRTIVNNALALHTLRVHVEIRTHLTYSVLCLHRDAQSEEPSTKGGLGLPVTPKTYSSMGYTFTETIQGQLLVSCRYWGLQVGLELPTPSPYGKNVTGIFFVKSWA